MEGVGREAVHRLKYGHLRAVVPDMAGLLARHLTRRGITGDLVVPVPLHPRRLRQRGYNQAELLARHAGRVLEIPVESQGLRRRHDPPQARSAGREERRANVAGTFEARRGFDGLEVLALDDVVTTGATLEACAVALKAAGASRVWGVAFAHEL
jgi:ComF family protein